MTNIKLSLTIILPGSTMISKEESLKKLTKTDKSGSKEVLVPDFEKNDKFTIKVRDKGKPEVITVFTRKCKAAKQVVNLTEEAYNYMVSNEMPANFKGRRDHWTKLSKSQKLLWHCENIASQVGGSVGSYEVLD